MSDTTGVSAYTFICSVTAPSRVLLDVIHECSLSTLNPSAPSLSTSKCTIDMNLLGSFIVGCQGVVQLRGPDNGGDPAMAGACKSFFYSLKVPL